MVIRPADRREAVVHAVDGAVGRRRGEGRPCAGGADAEAGLFALHVAAGLIDEGGVDRAVLRKLRCRVQFSRKKNAEADGQHEEHREKQCPSLPLVFHIPPEGEAERGGNQQNADQFNQIGSRVRVFKRMRRVHAEEAAAVRSELLNRNLTRCRALRNDLAGHDGSVRSSNRLKQIDLIVAVKILNDALRSKDDGNNKRQRKQNIDNAPDHIHPEAADAGLLYLDKSADQREQHGDARRGGKKVLHGEAEHLRQVAHGAFAGIGLPVGVRHKADGVVERKVPAKCRRNAAG